MRSARFALFLPLFLAACAQSGGSSAPSASPAVAPAAAPPMVGMANPASVYCESEKIGGFLILREGEDGGQFGVCLLPNGEEIEEWALFRRDNPQ